MSALTLLTHRRGHRTFLRALDRRRRYHSIGARKRLSAFCKSSCRLSKFCKPGSSMTPRRLGHFSSRESWKRPSMTSMRWRRARWLGIWNTSRSGAAALRAAHAARSELAAIGAASSGPPACFNAVPRRLGPGCSVCRWSQKAPCMCAEGRRVPANSWLRHRATMSASPPPDEPTSWSSCCPRR